MLTDDWIKQAPDTLQLAASSMDMSKGEPVFRFGGEVDAVYLVLEGEICLTRFSPEGTEIVLYRAP